MGKPWLGLRLIRCIVILRLPWVYMVVSRATTGCPPMTASLTSGEILKNELSVIRPLLTRCPTSIERLRIADIVLAHNIVIVVVVVVVVQQRVVGSPGLAKVRMKVVIGQSLTRVIM